MQTKADANSGFKTSRPLAIFTACAILAAGMLLAGCEANAYKPIPDSQWSISGTEQYSAQALSTAAAKGSITMSLTYNRTENDRGMLIGIPWSYTWIRVSAGGKKLYEAGSENRRALAAAAKYVLIDLPDEASGRITVEARITAREGIVRPFAAIGSERALLERAAAKSLPRILLSALNVILFAAFALAFALKRRSGHPARTLTFGLLNLALALNYLLETPIVGIYAKSYLPVSLIEDCAYFFLLPLAFRFITDTIGLHGRLIKIARTALLAAASVESAYVVLSFSFLSGFLYMETYTLAAGLALATTAALFVYLAPRALVRKGNERTMTFGLFAFIICGGYEVLTSFVSGLPETDEIAFTQIAFFAMVASLALTAVGRYDRLKWKLEEISNGPTADNDGTPGANDEAKERRRKKIAGDPAIERRVAYLLDTERVWNDETLSLPQFAELVGAPPHDVTLFIGERYGMHFTQLINGRRIEESKRLLADTDYTVLRIALESGFSSKTAFYRVFRETVGTSPAQFRAEARSESN